MAENVKKDCFAYDSEKKNCKALNALYCSRENCKFFKQRKNNDKEEKQW